MKSYFTLLIFLPFLGIAQESITEKNFKIFSVKSNKEISLDELIEQVQQTNVLFYGEEHNDSVAHFLEKAIFEKLQFKKTKNLALSLEMFDRDVQIVMNEYLSGAIKEKHMLKDARAWSNYRDYKPMVELAKEKKIKIICANAASRYTNIAGRKGQKALSELPPQSKTFFAPLPYDTASGDYYNKLMGLSDHQSPSDTNKSAKPVVSIGNYNLVMGQSLWDATMAYSINEYYKKNPNHLIFQVNGRFHSDEKFAVVSQLKKYNPKIKTLVISSGKEESFPIINWTDLTKNGDFIIAIDPKVPDTY